MKAEDAALFRDFVRQGSAGMPLAADVFEWVLGALRPASERRAWRDELLRRAGRLIRAPVWVTAGRIATLAREERLRPMPGPDPSTPRGCVGLAVRVYPGRCDRGLSQAQIWRLLTARPRPRIRPVEMQVPSALPSARKEKHMPHRSSVGAEILDDARDKFIRGATAAIIERAGHARLISQARQNADLASHFPSDLSDPGEFRGTQLLDLARMSLERQGVSTRGLHGEQLVKRALGTRDAGMNLTGDFAVLLETAVNKIFLGAYAIAPVSWRRWCALKSVADFRTSTFYRPGTFGRLDTVTEAGEVKHKNIPDGAKATLTPSTKGNIIGLSRRAVVNDDLGAFRDLAAALGDAAASSIEYDAFALITANAGLGVTMADGSSVFHANHSNIGPTGAMTAATLDGARAKLRLQKDAAANTYLNTTPRIWLGPVELGGQARQANASQYDPAKTALVPNIVAGLFSEVIDSPYLSAQSTARHYLLADPAVIPTFAVGFIDGNEAPRIDTLEQAGYDGVQMRVILDYGVAALDFRGSVTCAGA